MDDSFPWVAVAHTLALYNFGLGICATILQHTPWNSVFIGIGGFFGVLASLATHHLDG